MRRAAALRLTALLVLALARACFAESAPPPAPTEPLAPASTAAVQKLLEEAAQHAQAKRHAETLAAGERALAAARGAHDAAGEALAEATRARAMEGQGRAEDAVTAWQAAAAAWERAGDGPEQVAALAAAGLLLVATQPDGGRQLLDRALERARAETRRPRAVVQALHTAGQAWGNGGYLEPARVVFAAELALEEKLDPNSLGVARGLFDLGITARSQNDLAAAKRYFLQALTLRERLAPNSLELAANLNDLGTLVRAQGDLGAATQYYRRALGIKEKVAPNSLTLALTLNNLGNAAQQAGDLAAAERYHGRALAIKEQLRPDSLTQAASLHNLGAVALERGNLAAAGDYLHRALALRERLAPNSLDVAASLGNLGLVAFEQGDLIAAAVFHLRAQTILERVAPNSPEMASALGNLGTVAKERGDPAARDYFQRALSLQQRLAPNSLTVATLLDNLGAVAIDQGDLAAAAEHHRQALAIEEKLAPNSLAVAATLANLGLIAHDQGDRRTARVYFQRALELQQRLAPRSLSVATSLGRLADLAAHAGNWREAEAKMREAWHWVRRQAAGVTGDEPRQAFGASTTIYAAALVRAQLRLGKVDPAFRTLEEGRAQALHQLLAERHLDTHAVPASLRLAYQTAITARDRAEREVSQASIAETLARRTLAAARERAAPAEELAPLQQTLNIANQQFVAAQMAYTHARGRADLAWAPIRQRTARALAPSLSLAQTRSTLPANSVFVAFAVGDEQTHVFIVPAGRGGPPHFSVHTITITRRQLRERAAALRTEITAPFADPIAAVAKSRSLFALLFPGKSRRVVLGARRLLISPDGPLWTLPFAALVVNAGGPPHYLGLEKSITYAQSLALFAQVRRDRRRPIRRGPLVALAVGDPIFDGGTAHGAPLAGAELQSRNERALLVRSGSAPVRLPHTRTEAVAIARLYGSQPLLRQAATEMAVRRQIQEADVIHLATHGSLHPTRAMSSGLLLTPPETEPPISESANDGVLQAWEIYSQLKLRAELVVLSACETGRGQNVASEGIVGLTRALQYAGARSVVASQWKVADASTAALMVAFHRNVRTGMAKDEALRQAMALVRKNPRTAHPYYWAAFFLTGDPDNPVLGAQPRRTGKLLRRRPSFACPSRELLPPSPHGGHWASVTAAGPPSDTVQAAV